MIIIVHTASTYIHAISIICLSIYMAFCCAFLPLYPIVSRFLGQADTHVEHFMQSPLSTPLSSMTSLYGESCIGQVFSHSLHLVHALISVLYIFVFVFLLSPVHVPNLSMTSCIDPMGQNTHHALEFTNIARIIPAVVGTK